jgi:hypothetical protein
MRTILTICTLFLLVAATPQRDFAQVRSTTTITATVVPSVSIELQKSNTLAARQTVSSLTMNLRGTENILVVVDSKETKSVNILQLTNDKPVLVTIPSSQQTSRTSIAYLSS